MDRTAVVEMVWKQRHRIYRKQMRRVARFYIHDPENECRVGDTVRIQETRPISKTKHWRLLEILQRRQIAEVRPIELETDIETVIAGGDASGEAALEEQVSAPEAAASAEPESTELPAEQESTPEAPAPRQRAPRSRRAAADTTEEEPETAPETPSVEADEAGEAAVDEMETGAADSTDEEPETIPETPSVEAAVDELETGAVDSTEEESKE